MCYIEECYVYDYDKKDILTMMKGGRMMSNRNGSQGSGNQGSPKSGQFQQEFGSEITTGNDNKGKEYRSKKGSKSKKE